MPYLIDSDILIDFFRKRPAAADYLDSVQDWSYSIATAMEVFAGAKNQKELGEMEKFLAAYEQIPLSDDVGVRGLEIMKSYVKSDGLDAVDAMLAATAILRDMTFSTRNGKHFRNIKGLKLEIIRYPTATENE